MVGPVPAIAVQYILAQNACDKWPFPSLVAERWPLRLWLLASSTPLMEEAFRVNGAGARYLSVGVLIWLLSRNLHLGAYYIHRHHAAAVKRSEEDWPDDATLARKFLYWWSLPLVHALVCEAADDPRQRSMVLAMEFLVRSCVAEYVFKENAENRSVQPRGMISRYLKYWLYRGVPDFMNDVLLRLTHSRGHRGHFFQKMREEWGLRAGTLSVSRDVTVDETTTAVDTALHVCMWLSHATCDVLS